MPDDRPPLLPGRLGTPDMQLRDDPRADPRMIAAMTPFGMDGTPPPSPVGADSPYEQLLEFCAMAEAGFDTVFATMLAEVPKVAGVVRSTEVIRGIDGNDITLFIHRPAAMNDASTALPAILHLHGGGMSILEAAASSYTLWRDELAATGLIVVGVEFRNSAGKQGSYPFPAGLNDCSSALQWVSDNKARLNIARVVVSGESGGGNLSLATTLKAKRDGKIDQIAGVYAQCPYISNAYAVKRPELPSLYENDAYFLDCTMMGVMAKVYDPTSANTENPLAWPYHATVDDLSGLPPHVISVNELDPLRDEGLSYFRKLLGAGVSARSRTVNGTCHAGDCLFRMDMPEVFLATIHDIHGFAHSL